MSNLNFHASDLIKLQRVVSVCPSPEDEWLAVVSQRLDKKNQSKYIHDLWRVPANGLGPKVRLSHTDDQDQSPGFDHFGTLIFLSNRAHQNEDKPHTQLWCFPPHGGDARRLTNEPLGVNSYQHARDEDVFVVATQFLADVSHETQRETASARAENGPSALVYHKMPVRYWDHWRTTKQTHLIVFRDGERLDLTPNPGTMYNMSDYQLSPDGRWLAVVHNATSHEGYGPRTHTLRLIDTHSGEHHIIIEDGKTWIDCLVFNDQGTQLALNQHPVNPEAFGQQTTFIYDIEQKTITAHPITDWDIWFAPASFSTNSTRLFGTADIDGQTAVFALDLDGKGTLNRLTDEVASGCYSGLVRAPTEDILYGIYSAFVQPPEAFRLDPQNTPQAPYLPAPLNRPIATDQISIEYTSATSSDGLPCPYFVLKTTDNQDQPKPALMWIHGGPVGQWANIWHWRWNVLVGLSQGYTMILPNPRGSTGLGQKHVEDIWGNQWGAQCFDDLMAVTEEVAQREDIDDTKMVAMGGSFGGYMTNWIGTQTDKFCCLVSHAGLTSFRTFHGVTDNPSWWSHMMNIDPFEQSANFDTYSPLTHIKQWKSPTLVIHGQQDYRVPVGEALILFDALQAHKVDSQLLIFPDENHWILKPKNIQCWYEHVFQFMATYVHRVPE